MLGENSHALFAQEIAGGGGNATNYLDVSREAAKFGQSLTTNVVQQEATKPAIKRLLGLGMNVQQACDSSNTSIAMITSMLSSLCEKQAQTSNSQAAAEKGVSLSNAQAREIRALNTSSQGAITTTGDNSSAIFLQAVSESGGTASETVKVHDQSDVEAIIALGLSLIHI